MIFRGPYNEVTVPEQPLPEFVLARAGELSGKPALIDAATGRVTTYGELRAGVRRAAAGLHARGMRKGDVLALFSPNLPEYAVAFHGVATMGGVVTPVNPLYTAPELAHQLKDAGAKYLLTIPQLLDKAVEAARGTNVQEIFVFGEAEGATPFGSLLENDGTLPEVDIDPREDLVALPYSSGTTGVAKGVMLTHYNMVANLCQLRDHDMTSERDTLIAILPFFHIYGMNVVMNYGLHKGASIVVMPRFEMEQFLTAMQDLRRDARAPRAADHPGAGEAARDRRVRPLQVGAHHVGRGPARRESVVGLLRTIAVRHQAGLRPDRDEPRHAHVLRSPAGIKYGSVGQCVPSTECKVVDLETGAELGPGEEGELWVRGPQVMKGYLNRPEATAQTVDADGWLHTGDIGYADAEGHFFIVDRAKELIKYKGFQVAPAELEAMLLTHPAVADAAVIPSPDEEAGEVPKAFVVLKGEATERELKEYVAARVAPHKKIRRLEFIEQIPKSPSGKILRRVLVQRERK